MAVGSGTCLRMSILNRLLEDLKVIFLTECKIRFIQVGFNCKRNIARIENAVQVIAFTTGIL